jgi:hypothetical protein
VAGAEVERVFNLFVPVPGFADAEQRTLPLDRLIKVNALQLARNGRGEVVSRIAFAATVGPTAQRPVNAGEIVQ